MKTSPLHEIHKSLSATFNEAHGWEMPSHYGNAVAEHLNVRKGTGIVDLSHRGKLRISGKDRVTFLQRILSQDINKIRPSTGAYSTLLDVKGRMLACMCLLADEGSFLIDLEPGLAEKVSQILNRYLFREDVNIEDVSEKYGLLSIQGPQSKQVMIKVSQTETGDMPECSHIDITINAIRCKAVKTSYSGEEGYNVYAPYDEMSTVWSSILSAGTGLLITPFGLDALETLRIEAGIPLYFTDMDEHTLPVEANLDKAISYDKGCYIGQETIARIKFRGHVNKTLTGFLVNGDVIPQKGDRVIGIIDDTEDEIGIITSGCLSPTFNRPIAMGYIRIAHNKPDEPVFIERDLKKISATVTNLPFYQRP